MRDNEVAEIERRAKAGELLEEGPEVEIEMASSEMGARPQVGEYLHGPYRIREILEESPTGWRLRAVTLVPPSS